MVHVQGPPSLPWETNDVPRGEIHHHFYVSSVAADQRDFYVYTPPGYDPAAKTTYPVLRHILEQYADILTVWRNGKMEQGAVTAILTGDHPAEEGLAWESVRYAAIDGTLKSLQTNPPPDLVPWMSSQWSKTFRWRGKGEFPPAEAQKLRQLVGESHDQHRLVRFWGAPDNPAAWKELRAAGVDLINTDDLRGAQQLLLDEQRRSRRLRAPGDEDPCQVRAGRAPRG